MCTQLGAQSNTRHVVTKGWQKWYKITVMAADILYMFSSSYEITMNR